MTEAAAEVQSLVVRQPDPTDSRANEYRPHLDGLRAIAVYLVVLFHSGVSRFAGGFIGVDVFFVLSGYLVTQMLVRDREHAGGIRFRRFYARRFRRLLPASAVALVVTALVYAAVAGPGESAASVGAFRASFLYVANWFFVRESTGYFAADVAQSPVLQFWSLAIEEQFYLVWPLTLAALYAVARRATGSPDTFVRVVLAVAALASLGWALVLQGSDVDRAYYGTDARAYQLLAGALLALAPGLVAAVGRRAGRAAPVLAGAALLGLGALATSNVDVAPITRGALATLVAVVVIASLEVAPRGLAHVVLSWEPVVYLGRISYGTYLWHWPTIIVATILAAPGSKALFAITALLSTGLASLSYHLLEMPVRRSPVLDERPVTVVVCGLVISLVGGLLVAPAILDRPAAPTTSAAGAPGEGFTPVPADIDLDTVAMNGFGEEVICTDDAARACTVVDGDGPHILLMGDSNATMMTAAFTALAEQEDLTLTLATMNGCPWQRDLDSAFEALRDTCDRMKEYVYTQLIPTQEPDVVAVINTELDDTANAARVADTTRASVPQLTASGATAVLIEPIVFAPDDPGPLECLASATFLEDCRFVADTAPAEIELLYRQLAESESDVISADLDTLACPYLPICDPVIRGQVVRWNFQHLAEGYSRMLGGDLAAYLRSQGLIAD